MDFRIIYKMIRIAESIYFLLLIHKFLKEIAFHQFTIEYSSAILANILETQFSKDYIDSMKNETTKENTLLIHVIFTL